MNKGLLKKTFACGLCLSLLGAAFPVAAVPELTPVSYSIVGSMTNWGAESDIPMYETSEGRIEGSTMLEEGEWEFLIRKDSDWNEYWGAYDYEKRRTFLSTATVVFDLECDAEVNIFLDTSGSDMTQWEISYSYTDNDGVLHYFNTGKGNETEIIKDKSKPDISVYYETKTDDYIYYDNRQTGWDEVYAYWSNMYNERVTDIEDNSYGCYFKEYSDGNIGYPPISFPGTEMTEIGDTGIWQINIPYNATSVIFSNGKTFEQVKNGEASYQSADIAFKDSENAGQIYNIAWTGDIDADFDHGSGLTETKYTAKDGGWSDYSGEFISQVYGRNPDLLPQNIKNPAVTGSFTGWSSDIAMNDEDGDGVFEAYADIPSVTEEMLTDKEPDGRQAEEKSLRFMIRIADKPERTWGSYEEEYNRVFGSQISIPVTETVNPGDHVSFRVFFDTTRNAPDAVSAYEKDNSKGISPDAKAAFDFLYAGYDNFRRTLERGDYTYEAKNGVLTLIEYSGSDSEIRLPAYVDNMPLKVIGENSFYQNHSVSRVILPDTVTTIENRAFNGCSMLKELVLGEGVQAIEQQSVFYCDSFEAYNANENNTAFKAVDGVLFNNAETTLIGYPQGRSGDSYIVPESVKIIGSYAFYNCMGLRKISVPESIAEIDEKAVGFFYDKASGTDKKTGELVICGRSGTASKSYAEENGFAFEEADVLPERINLSKYTAVVVKGSSITLTAAVLPDNTTNKTVVWSSSDNKIATVSNGKVTAMSAGKAKITAETINGKKASCDITVKLPDTAVTAVKLNKTSLVLTKGQSSVLTAEVEPSNATNKTITWTSSNTSVASVSGGKVTALSAGTAVITAKSNNGKTASCTVTVKNPAVNATSIKLDKTATGLGVGETITLRATTNPSNATVTWTSSNTSVVTVSNGKITGKKVGTATITAASGNVRATCSVTVKAAPTSVTLSKTAVSIGVGEKFSVSAILPANTAAVTRIYSSSNSSVVKMTRTSWIGEFVGVKTGTAAVTVRLYNGKTAKCTVVVRAAPTSVSLSKSSMSLGIGESFTLSAVLPSNTAAAVRTYSSSNPSVLQMTRTDWVGTFKALKKGTAKITVKLYNGKTASCTVYVNPAPSNVKLSKTSITLKIGQSASLSAIIPAGTSAATRTYRSSNSATVKMTRTDWVGNFKALKTGSAWVTVTLFNGKSARCLVTVIK